MDRILSFDICSIFILIVLLISFFAHRMTKGQLNKAFNYVVTLVLISAVADVGRVLITRYFPHNIYSQIFFDIICYVYLFARNITLPFFVLFIYRLSGMWHDFKSSVVLNVIWHILVFAVVLLLIINCFNRQVYSISKNLIFERGPLMYALYILNAATVIYSLVCITLNRKKIERRTLVLLYSLIFVTVTGVLIQMIFPRFSVEIFCTTIPLTFTFILIQKPGENIDSTSKAYSYYAFLEEIHRYGGKDKPLSVIYIKILDEKKLEEHFVDEAISGLLSTFTDYFYKNNLNNETEIFYLYSYTFAITTTETNLEEINKFSQKILNYLKEPKQIGKSTIFLNTKICMVRYPEDIPEFDQLLSFSKNFTKCITKQNEVTSFSEETKLKDFNIKLQINEIIARGIKNKSFQMYYQPIYNVRENKFTSAEALIRLIDEKYGFISPAIFIPAAEESGAIHEIGDFVLQDVCRFVGENNVEKIGINYIELNLSVAQCIEVNLVSKINKIISKTNISKEQINLEITETANDLDSSLFYKNVNTLSEQNYTFSLDDYGTGYSNILRIMNFPVEIIKLDKSFADDYKLPNMALLTEESIRMVHKLQKKALIEGVEEKECLNKFLEWGIDFVQGYYFSKPLPEKDFITFVQEKNGGKN